MLRSLTLFSALMLTACVYRVDIQQGNYVDIDRLAQVEVGMDERQVSYLLGDPVADDAFHGRRWTYVYYLKRGDWDSQQAFDRHVVIHFDDEGIVTQIDGAEYARDVEETADDFAEDSIGPVRSEADSGS